MAALLSTDFTIPAEISQGIFERKPERSGQHVQGYGRIES